MVNLPDPEKREIIARKPFVDEMVGDLVAHLWHGTPQIDLVLKPEESDQYAKVGFTVREARKAAAELLDMADVAQRAMWTPKLLASVRERYLPGATDAEIIARLTRLADRDEGFELRASASLFPADGQALIAEAHGERVEHVAAVLSTTRDALTELDSVVGDLRKIYAAKEDEQ